MQQTKLFKRLLIEGYNKITNTNIKEDILYKCIVYKNLLLSYNKEFNLTAIETEKEIATKHFLDSWSITPFIKNDTIITDFGTGAGFPGIPIAINHPQKKILLVEKKNSKIYFLNIVKEKLNLDNIKIINYTNMQKEIFSDVMVVRAVGNINKVIKLTRRKINFKKAIFMKGKKEKVIQETKHIKKHYEIIKVEVPFLNEERHLIIII